MTRRCSHCSHNGHNSRTCPNRGVKLFGVRLTDGLIRKSASMGNLTHYMSSGGSGTLQNGVATESPADTPDHHSTADGYASEDFVAGSSSSRERKKGVAWTEEEHRMFLLGLQKLGKGDWRGIARNYVISRTPTQVASHAQKYFIRQCNISRRKRRSSLFDMIADQSTDAQPVSRELFPVNPPEADLQGSTTALPALALDEECESMESANSNDIEAIPPMPEPEGSQVSYPVMYPAYLASFFFPVWPGYSSEPVKEESHEIVKPTPVHSKSPINVDELVGMSELTLGEYRGDAAAPSNISLKLVEGSNRRPSAFHPNPTAGNSDMKIHFLQSGISAAFLN